MTDFKILQQNTMKFSTENDNNCQSVAISEDIINKGFLKKFPGSTLAIFLYLITHLDKNNFFITTSVNSINEKLPYNQEEIKKGLNILSEKDIIMIDSKENKDKKNNFKIYINFEEVIKNNFDKKKKDKTKSENISNHLKQLMLFVPEKKINQSIINDFNKWIDDFEPEVIKELIRRVNKWCKNNNNETEEAYHYLKAIVKDWYKKKIFTYERLQFFDKLYQETRELAQTYGIKQWQNINSVQMQTFKSWLNGDFALSLPVAKFAIKEAIKRKKDGQPSLKYIEDNYIKPWKKENIKTVKQAQMFLNNYKKNSGQNKKQQKTNWESFPWELDKIT